MEKQVFSLQVETSLRLLQFFCFRAQPEGTSVCLRRRIRLTEKSDFKRKLEERATPASARSIHADSSNQNIFLNRMDLFYQEGMSAMTAREHV